MPDATPKITRVPAPVREQVVDLVRDSILHGHYQPGQRLIERELCAELDVSRNTLREALRQLEAERWITITPHRGPRVMTMSDTEAGELYEVRQALECLAVRLFVERADAAALEQLQKAHLALRDAHLRGDVPAMLETKRHFYDALYRGAANESLRAQAALFQDRLFLMRQRSLAAAGRAQHSIEEIDAVMTQIVARDPETAAGLWGEHIHHAAHAALTASAAAPPA